MAKISSEEFSELLRVVGGMEALAILTGQSLQSMRLWKRKNMIPLSLYSEFLNGILKINSPKESLCIES